MGGVREFLECSVLRRCLAILQAAYFIKVQICLILDNMGIGECLVVFAVFSFLALKYFNAFGGWVRSVLHVGRPLMFVSGDPVCILRMEFLLW